MRIVFLIAILITINIELPGQDTIPGNSRYALSLGIGHQQNSQPFRKMLSFPHHTTIEVALKRNWGGHQNNFGYQNVQINAFRNLSSGSGYTLTTGYGFTIPITGKLYLSPEILGGLIHLFRPFPSYEPKEGELATAGDLGSLDPIAGAGIVLGFENEKLGFYVNYEYLMQFGYNETLPFFHHTFLTTGIGIKL